VPVITDVSDRQCPCLLTQQTCSAVHMFHFCKKSQIYYLIKNVIDIQKLLCKTSSRFSEIAVFVRIHFSSTTLT